MRRPRRDIWRCPRCAGTHLAATEVERRLRLVEPEISDEVIRDVMTARPSRGEALACPACQRAMQPISLGGVRVTRCAADDQIWLDAAALERVFTGAGARHQSQRSWIGRLLSHLFAT